MKYVWFAFRSHFLRREPCLELRCCRSRLEKMLSEYTIQMMTMNIQYKSWWQWSWWCWYNTNKDDDAVYDPDKTNYDDYDDDTIQNMILNMKERCKHRHRQNVTSHSSFSLLWQLQLIWISAPNNLYHQITSFFYITWKLLPWVGLLFRTKS